jgi:hypothetical protein
LSALRDITNENKTHMLKRMQLCVYSKTTQSGGESIFEKDLNLGKIHPRFFSSILILQEFLCVKFE